MTVQLVSLTQLQNTVRRMTARYTETQMTTAQVNYYINLSLTIFLPLLFKNLKLTKPYVFNTVPNVDTYDFIYENNAPNPDGSGPITAAPGNISVSPPVFCQGYILRYMQDKSQFYNRWPKLSVNQQIGSGNGSLGPYSGTIPTSTPFLRAQLDIFGTVTEPAVIISMFDNSGFNYALTDKPLANNNTGNLIDPNGIIVGTVNYLTGAYTFTLIGTIVPNGDPIYASVVPYQSSRPTDVLFYNQQFVLRPVPQQVYQMEFQISQQPIQLIANNQAPELDEWYLLVCSQASKLIYTDFPDPEGMAYVEPIYQEQIQIAQRRSLRQLSTQRASTIFSAPVRPLASWFMGDQYSGSIS